MDMCPGFHFWDKWEEEEESCRGHGEKLSLSVSACSRAQPCSMQTTAPSLLSPPLSGPPQPIVPDFAGCKHKGLASASCFRALLYQGMEGQMQPQSQVTSQRLCTTLSANKQTNKKSYCHDSLEFSLWHGAGIMVIHQPGLPCSGGKAHKKEELEVLA